jgi:hypothetical protein
MGRRLLSLTAALSLAAALSACETATPYQPLQAGAAQAGGYSDTKIEPNRFKVTFQGNGMTSRDTVETYLLYRAAELTLHEGYDWFETVDRATDKHVDTYADPLGPGPYGFPGWRPYWRYYGGGFGWRGWDPYGRDPFWADNIDVTTVEKYETSAEIVMGNGPKPIDDKHAFDAHQVAANLASKIIRPK